MKVNRWPRPCPQCCLTANDSPVLFTVKHFMDVSLESRSAGGDFSRDLSRQPEARHGGQQEARTTSCMLFRRPWPSPVCCSGGQGHILYGVQEARATSCMLFRRPGPHPVCCSGGQGHILYAVQEARAKSCMLFRRPGTSPVCCSGGQGQVWYVV